MAKSVSPLLKKKLRQEGYLFSESEMDAALQLIQLSEDSGETHNETATATSSSCSSTTGAGGSFSFGCNMMNNGTDQEKSEQNNVVTQTGSSSSSSSSTVVGGILEEEEEEVEEDNLRRRKRKSRSINEIYELTEPVAGIYGNRGKGLTSRGLHR